MQFAYWMSSHFVLAPQMLISFRLTCKSVHLPALFGTLGKKKGNNTGSQSTLKTLPTQKITWNTEELFSGLHACARIKKGSSPRKLTNLEALLMWVFSRNISLSHDTLSHFIDTWNDTPTRPNCCPPPGNKPMAKWTWTLSSWAPPPSFSQGTFWPKFWICPWR